MMMISQGAKLWEWNPIHQELQKANTKEANLLQRSTNIFKEISTRNDQRIKEGLQPFYNLPQHSIIE